MAVVADVGECLGEEGGVYCGGGVPVLDSFAGWGCCVWDSSSGGGGSKLECVDDNVEIGILGSMWGTYWSSG